MSVSATSDVEVGEWAADRLQDVDKRVAGSKAVTSEDLGIGLHVLVGLASYMRKIVKHPRSVQHENKHIHRHRHRQRYRYQENLINNNLRGLCSYGIG